MDLTDLILTANDRLESFGGAKSAREAEVPYRELNEYLIPEIDAEDHAQAMIVDSRLRALIAEKTARRYIPAT